MIIEVCPVHGDFCRTTFASLHISQKKQILPKETLMIEHIPHDSHARMVPLKHVMDQLHEAAQSLKNCSTHPGGATLLCIPVEQLRDLEFVLVRTDQKQKDWVAGDMLSAVESEMTDTRSAMTRLRPVVSKARDGELFAQDLLAALKAESDPRVARQRFLVTRAESTTIRDEQEVLASPHHRKLPKKYPAMQPYVLSVMVAAMAKTTANAHLLLIGEDLSGELFSMRDSGFRSVSTQVPGLEDLRCLNFYMAYDIAVSVELAISVGVGGAGLEYGVTLMRLNHRRDTMLAVKKAMTADQFNLFL